MADLRQPLTRLIHQTMPSAAVASGWASPVDPGPWVAHVSRLLPHADRPDDLRLSALTRWLETRGIMAGEGYVRALRTDWITCELAVESRRGK